MKAISLWQPWASLWLTPRKVHETRHWPTLYRGWLLLHAAQKVVREVAPELKDILLEEFGVDDDGRQRWLDLPRGALIGAIELVDCRRTETVYEPGRDHSFRDDFQCGNFDEGRYAWRRRGYYVFKDTVSFRGSQGFFNVSAADLPEYSQMLLARGIAA